MLGIARGAGTWVMGFWWGCGSVCGAAADRAAAEWGCFWVDGGIGPLVCFEGGCGGPDGARTSHRTAPQLTRVVGNSQR